MEDSAGANDASNRFRSRHSGKSRSPRKGDGRSLLILLLLAMLQRVESYVTVSMNGLCRKNDLNHLKLLPSSATSLLLDTSTSLPAACRMEITAPETHSISLLHTRRKKTPERRKAESPGDRRAPKCILTVSFPLLREDDEVKLRWDLCSEDFFSAPDRYVDVLPSRVTLEWNPMVKSPEEILVSEIVVAALGKGRDVCSQPDQVLCDPKYPLYCISKELVCDGKRNCPEGGDEDREMCSPDGNWERKALEKSSADTARIGHDWELLASEVLKKIATKENAQQKKTTSSTSTERTAVLWSDSASSEADESESLPDVLKHYGPWGYLMLGMLICGTVLMFCGLWECCCRKPKSSTTTAAGPTLLIINQGAQQGDVETPQTPGPPRYEDLDQPPSYATLFPARKALDFQTDILPITLPIVDSLSNLLSNSSSSQLNLPPEYTGHSASSAPPPPDVYAIATHRSDGESSPK